MPYTIDFTGLLGPKYACYEVTPKGKPINCLFLPHIKQIRYFESKKRHVLGGGGRGGGKTEEIIWKNVQTCQTIPGVTTIIFRRTMGELKKTIIEKWRKLPEAVAGRFNGSDFYSAFENGSKVWFASADDENSIRKLLSGEFHLMSFDEWSEWPYSQWRRAAGSCRSTFEHDIFGNAVSAQVMGATNPGGVGGEALNCLFGCSGVQKQVPGEPPEDYDPTQYEFIQSLVDDNPAYAAHTQAGKDYRQMLMSQPTRIRAAWLDGRWDGFEGQYFDCLDESVTRISHDVVMNLFRKQYWVKRWISIDWGMTHHAYASWHAKVELSGPDGTKLQVVITYHELLVKGMTEKALAQTICDHTDPPDRKYITKIYLSPDTFGDTSFSRARRMGDVFTTEQLPRPVPANNERTEGLRKMYSLLAERNNLGGQVYCGWLISDECPSALGSLSQAQSDPKKDGDILSKGDAVHLDVNDGNRYGIASLISPADKPMHERFKEEIGELPIEGSDRFIKHKELEKKEREGNSGVFFLGKKWRQRRRP